MFFTIPICNNGLPATDRARCSAASNSMAAAEEHAQKLSPSSLYKGIMVVGNTVDDKDGRAHCRIYNLYEKTTLTVRENA